MNLTAILAAQGGPFVVENRPTPTPGPNDLLVEVRSIALNPIDYYQRDYGFPPVAGYPSIVGSDIGGVVLSAGSSVTADDFQPGTRVTAFAPTFFVQGAPDYGAFQKKVLIPAVNASPIPESMSFNEAALLPMAVGTAWSGWYTIGLPRETQHTASDKQGMLVWGAASSIGSAAVQIAKMMGFTVYATASEKHHEYIKSLGASKVWDYRAEGVVESIVKAAQADGVKVQMGFQAAAGEGVWQSCMDILKEWSPAKLASAIPLSDQTPKVEGVDVKFVSAPADEKERTEFFHFVFNVWLKEKLDKGEYVPSPKIQVVEGGLEGANKGLDELKGGVSGVKLVLEV